MRYKAVICDIYKTLLEVGPAPEDAQGRWAELCGEMLPGREFPGLREFGAATEAVIAREHAAAKAGGVPYPEIFWPWVAVEGWGALNELDPGKLADFLYAHSQLLRRVRLMDGAGEVIQGLRGRGVVLGIASNSQPYTLREMEESLKGAAFGLGDFAADLCFYSFENGFSKPDPHVFRMLVARLARRGIRPDEALMIGDREDNDMAPARAHGLGTWRLLAEAEPGMAASGNWHGLGRALGLEML